MASDSTTVSRHRIRLLIQPDAGVWLVMLISRQATQEGLDLVTTRTASTAVIGASGT